MHKFSSTLRTHTLFFIFLSKRNLVMIELDAYVRTYMHAYIYVYIYVWLCMHEQHVI